jgi:hypothetical protein
MKPADGEKHFDCREKHPYMSGNQCDVVGITNYSCEMHFDVEEMTAHISVKYIAVDEMTARIGAKHMCINEMALRGSKCRRRLAFLPNYKERLLYLSLRDVVRNNGILIGRMF